MEQNRGKVVVVSIDRTPDPVPADRPHRLLRAVRLGILLHGPRRGGRAALPGVPPPAAAGITGLFPCISSGRVVKYIPVISAAAGK